MGGNGGQKGAVLAPSFSSCGRRGTASANTPLWPAGHLPLKEGDYPRRRRLSTICLLGTCVDENGGSVEVANLPP